MRLALKCYTSKFLQLSRYSQYFIVKVSVKPIFITSISQSNTSFLNMAQGCFNYICLITFQSLAPKKIKILLLRSSSFSPCEIDGQRSQSGAAPQKFTN